MTKRLLILLAMCSFSLGSLNGCTSKESKDEAEVATDGTATAAASGDNLDAVDGSAPTAAGSTTADALPEESLDNALSETPPAAESPAPSLDTPPSDATAKATEPSLDSPLDAASEPKVDTPASTAGIADIEPPTTPDKKPAAEMPAETAPAPVASSLQKVPEKPWTQNGILLNTVYFARPGDTVSSVSQMIYGADKTTELKKANPKLKNRDPKPSEKIFYNSPARMADSEKMMNYYEDAGVAPETYVTKEGDTIQKVGKNLLGYSQGWKEIWPTNAIESKGKLEAGTELKYWKGSSVASMAKAPPAMAPMAQQDLPPPPADMGNPPPAMPPTDANALPPPPPAADMAANMPPPPPSMDAQMPPPPPAPDQATNDLPPPPPPAADMAANMPPPPPPPRIDKKVPSVAAKAEGMDEETMVALGGIAVAALGLTAMLVVKRKRRQRELEAAFNETQVGT